MCHLRSKERKERKLYNLRIKGRILSLYNIIECVYETAKTKEELNDHTRNSCRCQSVATAHVYEGANANLRNGQLVNEEN